MEGVMPAFIEVHTTAGMQELVNVDSIQSVKQMKKFTELVFTDEEHLDVVESYEDVKGLIRKTIEEQLPQSVRA
jgi:hypothetical protein